MVCDMKSGKCDVIDAGSYQVAFNDRELLFPSLVSLSLAETGNREVYSVYREHCTGELVRVSAA